jgi:hypothetical protein
MATLWLVRGKRGASHSFSFFEMNGSPYHGGIVTCAPLGMYYEFVPILLFKKNHALSI